MIQFGVILEAFSPEERPAWMKANVLWFARVLYRLFGRRQYTSRYRQVYGSLPA